MREIVTVGGNIEHGGFPDVCTCGAPLIGHAPP
jgi:hypothetical protein